MKSKNQFFRLSLLVVTLLFTQFATAQERKVSGTVTDSKNEPLIGVNVTVKGADTFGAITDLDGNYSLDVPSDAVLVASYIGYATKEVKVNGSVVNIVLEEDAQALDGVVVVGYGVMKKRDLTGSIASVKQKDITAVPTSNVLESMQGKVAGLDMTRSSGQPGSGFNFTIRGNRSLTASNAPLILVDGIAYGSDININPNDVESIEVLKDASTTAIYGSRG
ncbi:MAG: TonB-dependent receptor plug domain-containing protein, partial [Bacteroidales bacterium]|nr:TonB-dependent receptor plug domain-containing protein [Bacteroidales bacterium]